MLKTIFSKTLFEKRWSILIWFGAIAVFCLLIVVLFPTFRESFGEALRDTPDSLKSLLGEATDYQNINGYIDIQIINQMVFLTLIMGIVLGTALLSGEESSGNLQTLLAQPVSRTKIYWHKFAALAAFTLLGTLGLFFGALAGALLIKEAGSIDLSRLLLATIMTWLVTMVFAVLAYCIGAITGKKGVTGIVAGFLAFTFYMITILSETAEVLKSVNNLSPFKYYKYSQRNENGLGRWQCFSAGHDYCAPRHCRLGIFQST